MRESATELGKVKAADAQDAMNELTSAIRALADEGKLEFVSTDEEEDE